MRKKIKELYEHSTLVAKIRYSYLCLLVPFVLFLIFCFYNLWNNNRRYEDMINSSVMASQFSLDFQKDFDYETYLLIVGNKTLEESSLHDMLVEADGIVAGLEELTESQENLKRLTSVKKYLNNLETYIGRIEDNIREGNRYEDNMEIWENDVQIVTSLVGDTISQYIYYEIRGIQESRQQYQDFFVNMIRFSIIAFALILAVAFLADALCRKILLKVVAQLVKKTKATWDDIVFDRKVMVHLSRMVAPVIIYLFVPLAFVEVGSSAMDFIRRICLIYIIITFLSFVNSFLKAVYSVYSEREQFRDRPLKGMLQTMQVILWLVGGIVVVGELIGRDPLSLLAGLGASAAILMLVFKDSIMGFVSGVQLSANDMLRPGDWITMTKYGADGYVIEVSLTTVKVQNFDKTITTIPPYALVSDSFQNWRGMRECGGRRIKRSLFY